MVKKAEKKIRIRIQAFEHKVLDEVVKKIVNIVKDSWAKVVWPIPLPTKVEKVTVNRSTFVNKDAREQFELRRHKRIIDIIEPTAHSMAMLQVLNISNGVGIEIKA